MVRTVQRKKTFRVKKSLLIFCLIALFIAIKHFSFSPNKPVIQEQKQGSTEAQKSQSVPTENYPEYTGQMQLHVFVPYWRLSGTFDPPSIPQSSLNTLMYFAVHTLEDGSIDQSDQGYAQIGTFMTRTQESQAHKVLTLSMHDESISSKILEDDTLHTILASNLSSLAIQHGFDGIVLDLEYAALPTQEVIRDISSLTQTLSNTARSHDLSFSIAIYGDTYYRSRPYDIGTLAPLVDYIYIMAYDFHKSYGQPGPNFPLSSSGQGKASYPYSLENALTDFLQDSQPEQLIPTYGLYGYDWSVDDQNRPAKQAAAQTLNQIEAKYLPTCPETNCLITRDPVSTEMSITFTDSGNQKHTIWYEDLNSLKQKVQKSRSFSIRNSAIWAAGYF